MATPVTGRCLIVFAKPPRPGRVKTRLAGAIGARAATAAYRQLLTETVMRLAGCRVAPVELWGTGGRHPYLTALARRSGAVWRPQGGGDLGRRMQRALEGTLAAGRLPVIVGADCAGVTGEHVHAAFAALEAGDDAVFAPAADGGYALVGATRALPGLFQRMPWGSDRVMARTRRRLRAADCRWTELPGAWDVDDLRDLHRWRRLRARGALG